jgi:PAS domain S-box-containing protein
MTEPATHTTPRSVLALRDQVEILMVDDRPENLLALEALLEPLGQRLVKAHSGEEALRKLLTHDVAVILLDVQMPGMNGFDTAQMIKSRERTRFIPIIFLTAISKEEEYVFRGYQVGAVDYISKPFQPDVLRAKVAVFVDLHLKQKRLGEQEALLRESERRMTEMRHMREMHHSEARFKDIVSTAMDAIVIFAEDERITLFNGAAGRMFGISCDDAVGQALGTLFPVENSTRMLRELCDRVSVRGSDGEQEDAPPVISLEGRRFSGESFPAEASVSCFEGKEGKQYTLIVRDISERMRQQEQLQQAMAARSRFYASMSHELRTPINAVLGYSTLLLESIYGPLNEKQAEGIQRTQRAARHLLELVNDVLDLSKIEAGKIDLRLQPVSFPSIVEELFVTVRPLADKHHTTLALDHKGEPVTIVSDPRRVRQILLNLLSNAIKFGAGKPICVRVLGAKDAGVTLEVVDQGDGIPAADQERIFQEFVQLNKAQLQEGTGLGLPISRRLAELLGGTLTLESEPGKGSTFRLTLPATAESRARVVERELSSPPMDERRPQKANGTRAEEHSAASR